MKLEPKTRGRIAAVLLLAFLGFLYWWFNARRGAETDLVYDLSRTGRTDLVGLHVELHRDGKLFRETDFRYPVGEGIAPHRQKHTMRLPDGDYRVEFVFKFSKSKPKRSQTTLRVPQNGPVVLRPPLPR